jgi:hypothetical protein
MSPIVAPPPKPSFFASFSEALPTFTRVGVLVILCAIMLSFWWCRCELARLERRIDSVHEQEPAAQTIAPTEPDDCPEEPILL